MFIREAARKILEDIKNNPEQWNTDNEYKIIRSNLKIWIGDGIFFVNPEEETGKENKKFFNLVEKYLIYRAYKNLKKKRDKVYAKRMVIRAFRNQNKVLKVI